MKGVLWKENFFKVQSVGLMDSLRSHGLRLGPVTVTDMCTGEEWG